MKITYSVWQGSIMKGFGFTATSMADIEQTIKDLNSTNIRPKFEAFVSKVEQEG